MATDDKYKKCFSKNLNYYMNLKGKTQTDIIYDLNINKSAISSWCNGTRLPRMNKVQLLANYLNINISDLIEENYENNNYFEFKAEDDAMFPILDIGDTALVYKQDKLDQTNNSSKGTYLIKLQNISTIRKIILDEESNVYNLVAINPYCKSTTIPANNFYNEIKILGKVIKAENRSAFD